MGGYLRAPPGAAGGVRAPKPVCGGLLCSGLEAMRRELCTNDCARDPRVRAAGSPFVRGVRAEVSGLILAPRPGWKRGSPRVRAEVSGLILAPRPGWKRGSGQNGWRGLNWWGGTFGHLPLGLPDAAREVGIYGAATGVKWVALARAWSAARCMRRPRSGGAWPSFG